MAATRRHTDELEIAQGWIDHQGFALFEEIVHRRVDDLRGKLENVELDIDRTNHIRGQLYALRRMSRESLAKAFDTRYGARQ